jgi:hypothetical protein
MMEGSGAELGDLERLFFSTPHNVSQKWAHYFDVYERYFSAYRGKRVKFLEIGISQGGSLDIWKNYFGDRASIFGVDIDPGCRRFDCAQVEVLIGDQGDPAFLKSLSERIGEVDIILDDGGHMMDQQILSFQYLYPNIKEGGIYMCEDVHTSYAAHYGGGQGKPNSFIEYMKRGIDDLHGWYTGGIPDASSLSRSTRAISFYDSIVVVEKHKFSGPRYFEVGYSRPATL